MTRAIALLACVLFAPSALAQPELKLTLDVVRLVEGQEVPARDDLSITHEGIVYHFAGEDSMEAFRAEPARYEVADGGSCGSMGPLSGLGDPERFTVHEGRVYFFASDGCKARFLDNPARCIETDNPLPEANEASVTEGRALMEKLVAWAGGREAIESMSSFQFQAVRVETHSEKEWTITNVVAAQLPDHFMAAEQWNNLRYTTVSTPEGGAMGGMAGIDRIAQSRTRAFERVMARELPVLLSAYVDGMAEGDQPAMTLASLGESDLEGQTVRRLAVAYLGATSVLSIEPQSGRPLRIEFTGRDGTSSVGTIARDYTRTETVSGITLPVAYTVSLDGKPVKASSREYTLQINPELPQSAFALQ